MVMLAIICECCLHGSRAFGQIFPNDALRTGENSFPWSSRRLQLAHGSRRLAIPPLCEDPWAWPQLRRDADVTLGSRLVRRRWHSRRAKNTCGSFRPASWLPQWAWRDFQGCGNKLSSFSCGLQKELKHPCQEYLESWPVCASSVQVFERPRASSRDRQAPRGSSWVLAFLDSVPKFLWGSTFCFKQKLHFLLFVSTQIRMVVRISFQFRVWFRSLNSWFDSIWFDPIRYDLIRFEI